MTEDEAKTKWCPFVRQVTLERNKIPAGATSYNRTGDAGHHPAGIPPASLCIASACMAWRWECRDNQPDHVLSGAAGGGGPITLTLVFDKEAPSGYCGLAGAPQ